MDNKDLEKIFEIVSFFDDARWLSTQRDDMINFYKGDLDDDTKLLTHWLCYITNRQMDFERIFDVGGFVFSELADHYKGKSNDMRVLLGQNNKNSFIRKDTVGKDSKQKYSFIGKESPNNLIQKKYPKSIENERVIFKSKILPVDYFSILYTLDILNCETYRKSLSCFIAEIYKKIHKDDKENLIQKILFSLHLLTYHNIGRKDYSHICNLNFDIVEKHSKEIKEILDNQVKFNTLFEEFSKEKIFEKKRAWCCLRDFLKSPLFNPHFRNALSQWLSISDIDTLCDQNLWNQLELPGDTWNNNFTFGNCILGKGIDKKYIKKDKIIINRILRDYYNKNLKDKGIALGYPEQFDISFTFVPRMCEKNNCDICPIGRLSDKGKDLICLDDPDPSKYSPCPVALDGCGYVINCLGREKCKLYNIDYSHGQPQ